MSRLPHARERLLESATALFDAQGVTATGIDQIIERAGVAKASLYNNFSGKDDLVAAYLARHLERFQSYLATLAASPLDGDAQVHALFAELRRGTARTGFSGCPFSKAALELSSTSRATVVIDRFYAALGAYFARALGVAASDAAVGQLIVCYDGAMTGAKVRHSSVPAHAAEELAASIVTARAA